MANQNNMGRPSRKLTVSDAEVIRLMLADGWHQARIAAHFDVNPGRISEVNTGKRFPINEGGAS